MSSVSTGFNDPQASSEAVLSDSDIQNVASDAIRNAARMNLHQGFELAEAFLHRAESSARLPQVLLIEYGHGDDQTGHSMYARFHDDLFVRQRVVCFNRPAVSVRR